MKTVVKTESDTETLRPMFPIVPKNPNDEWRWEDLEEFGEEEYAALAKKLKIDESVLRAFSSVVYDIRESVTHDLKTMWERMNDLEKRVKAVE